MKLAIGCDEAAFDLKRDILAYLSEKHPEIEPLDCGCEQNETALYPDIALKVATIVREGTCERGILLCGTGIGMCMAANKVPGIRAAVCHDPYSAERAMKSNDSHIMCMGARVIAPELARLLVDTWLGSEFASGNSEKKIRRMMEIEQAHPD